MSSPAQTFTASSRSVQAQARDAGAMARRSVQITAQLLKYTLAPALFVLTWEMLPRLGIVNPVFFPPFSRVAQAGWHLTVTGVLPRNACASIMRAVTGLCLATVIAVPLGMLISASRTVSDMLSPLLEAFRNTAPLALLPVITLVLGIGEVSKVTMVVYAAFWPILLNTISGVRGVDPVIIKAGRAMGLSPANLLLRITLPATLPTIFTGVRLALAATFLVLIAAEMVGARAGLGYYLNVAQANFQIPEMYAGILALSGLGLLSNGLLFWAGVRLRIVQWRNVK